MRSRGGHNNNPTARQFEAAFKRFLTNVGEKQLLTCLLTYKISQEHLELFSSVRSRRGHNNNPTATQFEAAFKRLLPNAQVGANCLAADSTTILNTSSNTVSWRTTASTQK